MDNPVVRLIDCRVGVTVSKPTHQSIFRVKCVINYEISLVP